MVWSQARILACNRRGPPASARWQRSGKRAVRSSRLFRTSLKGHTNSMRKTLKLSALAGFVASLGLCAAAADKPEVVTESIPGTTVKFDLIKVPAGKVTIDGKEVEVKPFAIGKTEVTWDEYDVYWQRLDLTAHQGKAGFDAEKRP